MVSAVFGFAEDGCGVNPHTVARVNPGEPRAPFPLNEVDPLLMVVILVFDCTIPLQLLDKWNNRLEMDE